MSTEQIALAVNGAAGRMGRQLLAAIAENSAAKLGAAFDAPGQAAIGVDSSVLAGGQASGILISDSVSNVVASSETAFSTIIDFSAPPVTLALLDALAGTGHRVVIGTTGFNEQQLAQIKEASATMPIVMAANYSIGVTVALSLLSQAAKALGDDYDVEITEAHHHHKVDAPSGTALLMGGVVADALGRDLKTCAVYGREGITGARDPKTIGFATVRAGDIVGEHTVLYAGNGERLEITHKSHDRMTFARGAVRAALWLSAQPAGLFDMNDVLGIART